MAQGVSAYNVLNGLIQKVCFFDLLFMFLLFRLFAFGPSGGDFFIVFFLLLLLPPPVALLIVE